ncbi:hypothetical protein AFK24_03080 [Pseudomonas syringae]|uniref:Uncharacterized protein n=1 Tax=Pseudomonas syringae TaxID=317 RepID=A0A1C7ZDA0_PSESX|nr:hypothetical protein [Pseudomonas syringae]OCR26528.1 hypothetical protein AFK24_03080 [Pseudomonas syringae]
MNLNEQLSFPTAEECDAYFSGLPLIERAHRKSAPQALMAADVTESGIDTGNDAEVSKSAPAVIAFADGVSAQNREAVMLGVEFAEAVASQNVDISKDVVEWTKQYAGALKHAGWLLVADRSDKYTSSNVNVTMDSVVLELISAVAGPNAQVVIQLVTTVLDKLQKNKPAMELFDRNRKKGTSSTFRIMPCLESAQGIPVTYLLAIHCESSTDSGGALFWKWSVSKLKLEYIAKGVNFSQGTYERNKQRVLDYLDGNAEDFFAGLK